MGKAKTRCCFCGEVILGEIVYCVPQGFPKYKANVHKPLCANCGGYRYPTLDEICEKLDKEHAEVLAHRRFLKYLKTRQRG